MASPRRIVAVGGHAGLGLATFQHLFRTSNSFGDAVHLILLVRDTSADHALTALNNLAALALTYDQARGDTASSSRVELRSLDLADVRSVQSAAARLLHEDSRIDTLWLNAAVAKSAREFISDNSGSSTEGGGEGATYEHTALVNHAAPLLLLDFLMPLLLDRPSANGNTNTKSRIVFTGSALHRNLSRERDPDEVLCADFQSSALPNRAENEHASSQSGVGSPPWSLRTSYAHSKFLQALGVRKFIRLLEQALQARTLQPGSSNTHNRSWNEMEVVLVQPGFIPTTGLSREAPLPTRILTSYLLPIMPGTSSFVSTLQEGAEVLAAALSWPLQQAHTQDAQPQHGFEVESAQERLIPAPGWVGGPSQASDEPGLTKALVAKGKVLQRPDERTDNVDLQDRWWPNRLCRTEWVHAPEQGSSPFHDGEDKHGEGSSGGDTKDESQEGNNKGGFGDDTSRPDSSPSDPAGSSAPTSTHQADRSTDAPPSDSTLALSPSSIASSSSTTEGTSRGDRTPTRSSASHRSRRLTVSEAATALHGLALSGSFLGEMPEMSSHFLSVDDCGPVRNSEGTLDGEEQAEGSSPRPGLIVDTASSTERQDANTMTVPTTPVKQHPESFQRSSPGPMSAASLPCRTPPRRQASSPLSLYSTSADMLSVRRASASALQPMAQPPQRVHASALMIGGGGGGGGGGGVHLMEESVENFVDDDEDGFRESVAGSPSRVRMHGMGIGVGGSGARYGSLSSSSSLSARRPSGPASTMWTGGYGMSSSSSPVPVPSPSPYYGWRSTSLGNGGSPAAAGGGAGGMAFSPSTASYTRSPTFPSRPPSFSQSHTRSASLSLIGSYDESLLSGRMSTMPSQPFEFDAELGVLGMGMGKEGACPRKLRCPKHLSVGFQARYYALGGADGEVSFSSSSSSSLSASPSPSPSWSPSPLPKPKVVPRMEKSTVGSPYVGSIDLEAFFFKRLGEVLDTVRPLTPATVVADSKLATHLSPAPTTETKLSPTEALAQVPAFPGYQVPPKGQIQLIVKNQNLTAVKVFLVKYDLSDMQPGTKTFVRQKSFVSADVSGDRSLFIGNGAVRRGRWQSNGGEREKEKETMRYAVHLQFACPPVVSGGAADSKAQAQGQGQARGTEYTIASARDAPMPVPVPVPAATAAEEPTPRRKTPPPKIYLHRNIRVVFAATGLDSFERLDVVMETPVGHVVVVGGGPSSSMDTTPEGLDRRTGLVYSEYAGPGEGWRRARRAVRKKLVGMKEAEEEVEEVERRRVVEVAAAQTEAEAEAARLEEEEEEEESRRGLGEVDSYGREEEEGAALESSVHSAFGIPMPRRAKSRAGSKRSSRAGFGGSEESDHLQPPPQLQQMISASSSSSSSSFGPSYPVLSGDVGRMADTRTPSPPPLPPALRAFGAASVRRRSTLSRSGTVPTLDENRVMGVLAPASNLTPATATGTVPTVGLGGLLASLPVSPNPSGGSPAQHQHQNHRQRRPGTSSSSSSSSFSADRDGAASADQELLDSWHRSLLRRNSSASSHGHGHGHGVMSNASMMGTNTTAGSRPVSPAHMLWNYSTSAGSRVGSSRPTSPDPMMVGTLPPLHERVCAINGDGEEEEPGGTAASLLAQLQAHQAMQQACQLQSMTGALAAAAANGVVPSMGSTTTSVTGTGMPRLIRRVSGAARPFSSSMSASVSSSSSGSTSAAAAGTGAMRAGGEAVMTEGYTVGACGSLVDDDKEKAGGGGGGQRWHASRSRQGSSSGMTR